MPIPARSRMLPWLLILAGVAARLFHLDAPLIGVHSWRQTDTAAIARNYTENGYRFAYPQVDWGGATTGYVESEFPLYTYAVAMGYALAGGPREWIGRLLAVVGFLVGALALFTLVRRCAEEATALWSTCFFLVFPLGVYYSRTFMGDAWMLAASIASLSFFHLWTRSGRPRHAALGAACLAVAALIKPPSLYLGLPVLWMAWTRYEGATFRRLDLWIAAAAIVAALAAWYWHAHRIALAGGVTFGIWEYGSDKWGNWNLVGSWEFWNAVLFRSLAERWFTWIGVPIILIGLALPRRTPGERLFDWWLAGVLVSCVIAARGNMVHEYYQLPFLPLGAVFAGKVFGRWWGGPARTAVRWSLAAGLAVLVALSAWRLADYWRREDPARSWEMKLADEIRTGTARTDRIVTTTGGNPTLLYHAHRKGWSVRPDDLSEERLRGLLAHGARYVAGRDTALVGVLLETARGGSIRGRTLYRGESGFLLDLKDGGPDPRLGEVAASGSRNDPPVP